MSTAKTLERVRDYIRRNSLEPRILRIIGEESVRNGTDKLTSRQIDQIIKETRMVRQRTRAARKT